MRVLFVCAGNTCRSLMLEFAFKNYLRKLGETGVEVCSAGILKNKMPMSPLTAAVLKAHSVPFAERMSNFCTEKEIREADFVIAATAEQAAFLYKTYACNKIISMRDLIGCDISDPFGQGLEAYEKTYGLINEALPEIFRYITAG